MGESGTKDRVKGRVEEALGSLADDEELKRKGRADQAAGKVKDKADALVDKVKEAATGGDDS